MKKLIPLFLAFFVLFSACTSSKKFLQKGDYDSALRKSVKKLQGDPSDDEEGAIVETAFARAQLQDIEKINFLRKEGRPDTWETILSYYYRLKERQDLVKTLPDSYIKSRAFSFASYDNEIIEAKKKAAGYLYAHASELLTRGTRHDARQAYNEFQRAREILPGYKDTDNQVRIAREAGMTNVLFKTENTSGLPLPPGFEEELRRMGLQEHDKRWIRYHTSYSDGLKYHYLVRLNIKGIAVSPESMREARYNETKKVADGWEYVLDAKGNVTKDEKGNDIKTTKYREIRCTVIESCQSKSARITALVEVLNMQDNQLIRSEPVVADAFFENESALALGDLNALSDLSRKKITRSPVPFPPDMELVLQAGATLKGLAKNLVLNNEALYR